MVTVAKHTCDACAATEETRVGLEPSYWSHIELSLNGIPAYQSIDCYPRRLHLCPGCQSRLITWYASQQWKEEA